MKSVSRAKAAVIVAILSLVYFVSYFARKDFAAVMAVMLSENIINKSEGGLIGMALFVCYGIGQLVSGYLGDKLPPSILLSLGLLTTALCNILMPHIPSASLMIPVWAVNGFAQAMLWPPIVRILADTLEGETFLRANLYVTSAAHISTILLYIFVPICVEFYDWKTVFTVAGIISAVVLLIFIVAIFTLLTESREATESKPQTSDTSTPLFSLLSGSGLIRIFLAIIMMGFLRDGIESWLPTLYAEAFSRDASEAVLVSAILPVFSIISIVSITALHKTSLFNNEARGASILFIIAGAVCVPIAILINFKHVVLSVICLVLACLVCACMHAVNFLFISCTPGRFAPYGRAATASGFSNACTYVGAAISMYGIGALADTLGWSFTVVSWILIATLGALFSVLSYRKYTRFINQKNSQKGN